jgi:hypothetical protein
MEVSAIIDQYRDAFMDKYGHTVLPGQLQAMDAIGRCRTPESGELFVQCPDCHHAEWRPLSCGHRSCPKCQNYDTSRWIDRQTEKLLPVLYFLATFTLPYELRPLTWRHQRQVYSLFFLCVSSTLKDFGLNPKHLGARIGMTMVLHTHNRRLEFHPHIHVVVPGGGIDDRRRQWKTITGTYLFSEYALAKVFRARFLEALKDAGLPIPPETPSKWVVDCDRVGKGTSVLQYLSKYLYRGVISETNIIANQNGQVTFKYTESRTGEICYRTLNGEDFLKLILQHVLPRGFRRVRDYGFLHGNAKKMLQLVQLILHVHLIAVIRRSRPAFKCPCCKSSMTILAFRYQTLSPG